MTPAERAREIYDKNAPDPRHCGHELCCNEHVGTCECPCLDCHAMRRRERAERWPMLDENA